MPLNDELLNRLPRVFMWAALGAGRMQSGADRISEAFGKDAAPSVGDLGLAFSYDESRDECVAIGIGLVRSIDGIASGTVRAGISPLLEFVAPLSMGELLGSSSAESLSVPQTYSSALVPSDRSREIFSNIIKLDPGVMPWLTAQFEAVIEYTENVQQSRVEAKDAVNLAAQIADVELPADAFQSEAAPTEPTTLLQTLISTSYEYDLEEELLPLDLQRFDGKLMPNQRSASMTVFEDRDRRKKLVVFSVNKKPIEEELGVDLLYWDFDHDAFTFVQYKRLEAEVSSDPRQGKDWVYKRRGELVNQLGLMPKGRSEGAASSDWRAMRTPFWFKFVRGDAGARLDQKVLKGMYVPADWLRLAVEDGSLATGPRGGFRISYQNAKYLRRSAFVELVSRGFIGTTSSRSKQFKKVIASLGRDRELIIAVKQSWDSDDGGATIPERSDGPRIPFD